MSAAIESENHSHAGRDFNGVSIPQNGQVLPGPFKDLKSEKNKYTIWSGIPILKEGQLPNSSVTSMNKSETKEVNHRIISNIVQGQTELIVTFSVKQQEEVNIRICDMTGCDVALLLNVKVGTGIHRLSWNKASTPAGYYILSIRSRTAEDVELFIVQ
jgi:hypothetical protein